jgi:hypothetical protein
MVAKEERETIIRIGALDKMWDIWSDDKKYITKLTKAGWVGNKWGSGFRFSLPLNKISIRKK